VTFLPFWVLVSFPNWFSKLLIIPFHQRGFGLLQLVFDKNPLLIISVDLLIVVYLWNPIYSLECVLYHFSSGIECSRELIRCQKGLRILKIKLQIPGFWAKTTLSYISFQIPATVSLLITRDTQINGDFAPVLEESLPWARLICEPWVSDVSYTWSGCRVFKSAQHTFADAAF
jgi:hypothetical protein